MDTAVNTWSNYTQASLSEGEIETQIQQLGENPFSEAGLLKDLKDAYADYCFLGRGVQKAHNKKRLEKKLTERVAANKTSPCVDYKNLASEIKGEGADCVGMLVKAKNAARHFIDEKIYALHQHNANKVEEQLAEDAGKKDIEAVKLSLQKAVTRFEEKVSLHVLKLFDLGEYRYKLHGMTSTKEGYTLCCAYLEAFYAGEVFDFDKHLTDAMKLASFVERVSCLREAMGTLDRFAGEIRKSQKQFRKAESALNKLLEAFEEAFVGDGANFIRYNLKDPTKGDSSKEALKAFWEHPKASTVWEVLTPQFSTGWCFSGTSLVEKTQKDFKELKREVKRYAKHAEDLVFLRDSATEGFYEKYIQKILDTGDCYLKDEEGNNAYMAAMLKGEHWQVVEILEDVGGCYAINKERKSVRAIEEETGYVKALKLANELSEDSTGERLAIRMNYPKINPEVPLAIRILVEKYGFSLGQKVSYVKEAGGRAKSMSLLKVALECHNHEAALALLEMGHPMKGIGAGDYGRENEISGFNWYLGLAYGFDSKMDYIEFFQKLGTQLKNRILLETDFFKETAIHGMDRFKELVVDHSELLSPFILRRALMDLLSNYKDIKKAEDIPEVLRACLNKNPEVFDEGVLQAIIACDPDLFKRLVLESELPLSQAFLNEALCALVSKVIPDRRLAAQQRQAWAFQLFEMGADLRSLNEYRFYRSMFSECTAALLKRLTPEQLAEGNLGADLLHQAIMGAQDYDVHVHGLIQHLIEQGVAVDALSGEYAFTYKTPLWEAAHANKPSICALLLKLGASKTVGNSLGEHLIDVLISQRSAKDGKVVLALKKQGFPFRKLNLSEDGDQAVISGLFAAPLYDALMHEHPNHEYIRFLSEELGYGALKDKNGKTLVNRLAEQGAAEKAMFLADEGGAFKPFAPGALSKHYWRHPLYEAIREKNNVESIKFLLDKMKAGNPDEKGFLDTALERGDDAVITELAKRGYIYSPNDYKRWKNPARAWNILSQHSKHYSFWQWLTA
tara:strand:- start:42482 stop:45535 length:3054 start_codon:yes stop_codon:yes gene_type:complete